MDEQMIEQYVSEFGNLTKGTLSYVWMAVNAWTDKYADESIGDLGGTVRWRIMKAMQEAAKRVYDAQEGIDRY